MTTLADLERVERELREHARDNAEWRLNRIARDKTGWADTIAAYIAAGGWQPIETAPKDTLVLVHCYYAEEPALARLTDAGWKLGVEHHETNCGTYCLGGSPGGYANFVTHWMPLPAAPSGTKENSDV